MLFQTVYDFDSPELQIGVHYIKIWSLICSVRFFCLSSLYFDSSESKINF